MMYNKIKLRSIIITTYWLILSGVSLLADAHVNKMLMNSRNDLPDNSIKLQHIDRSLLQLQWIRQRRQDWVSKQTKFFEHLQNWLSEGAKLAELAKFGITLQSVTSSISPQFLMTSYFSPIIIAKRQPDTKYRFPFYKKPNHIPLALTREAIYQGALQGKNLEIAYSDSLIDNFFMSVQGSGYLYLCDEKEKILLKYAGSNKQPYRSLGSVLIQAGKIQPRNMSMQAIKNWLISLDTHQQQLWMSHNPRFVFYSEQPESDITGAYNVELLPQVAIATDPDLIPAGSPVLIEYPVLDPEGELTGNYSFILTFALDKGSAIKGKRIDIYQGVGIEAGDKAGYHKYYGRVWRVMSDEK